MAGSLIAAGFDVWTPSETLRRKQRGPRGTFREIEVDLPILPTFVFAREAELDALAAITRLPISPHPPFSIFTYCGKVPRIGESSIAGLREEEEKKAAVMKAIRDAETHAEAERIRIAAIKSENLRRRAERAAERQRRAALAAARPALKRGDKVQVDAMPALVGVTGVFETSDGAFAEVRFGRQSWKIEGWRLMPADSDQLAA